MKSTPSGIAGILLLAGALGGVFVESSALSNAREENQKLLGERDEVQRLARENAGINRLRSENAEIETLRAETRDLHKLRNEVRQLRERKPEFDKLRAENDRLRAAAVTVSRASTTAAERPPWITKEALSDAGWGSPEATLHTFFWAMREGNLEKIRSCFPPETPDGQLPGGGEVSMASFKGIRVVAKKVVSANEVKLGIQSFSEGEAAPQAMALRLKRVGNEWKIDTEQSP